MRFPNGLRARLVVVLAVATFAMAVPAHSAVASGPVFTVTAQDGLYVRSAPTRDSTPLKLLPFLSQITEMECQLRVKSNPPEIWDKVHFDDLDEPGWVLDSFLTPGGGNEFNQLVPLCDKPPTGAIVSPATNSEVKPNAKLLVTGRFDDDRGIESVDYFVSTGFSHAWVAIGRAAKSATGTYSKEWTVSYPAGSRLSFAATVTDTGGNVVALTGAVTGILVTDRDQAPEGIMTSPLPGAPAFYGRPIELATSVTDDAGIDSVAFHVRDGLGEWVPAGTDASPEDDTYSVKWTATVDKFRPGTLLGFKAVATDAAGQPTEINGPNNVVVTQIRTKRAIAMRLTQFKDGSFGSVGRVTAPDGFDECWDRMAVRVERWAENKWVRAGTATTTRAGTYKLHLKRDYTSTFRAVVDEFTRTDGNICLAATSRKTHFGGGRGG